VEIEAHPEVHQRFELICSIPGIGRVLATNLLALTDDFTRFSSPRQLACHCGVAPFEHSSGSSIRGKTRTSPKANT
jgi:transposase